ncbi:hypothetical protein, partial [Xanthomonas perforans]|uniref:hypothetical protein n=1 Tax=Xanthomonas perforans TaxID=442694 RepID=UPI003CFF07D9
MCSVAMVHRQRSALPWSVSAASRVDRGPRGHRSQPASVSCFRVDMIAPVVASGRARPCDGIRPRSLLCP